MPKLVNRVPSYRKHKARGQAIVSLNGRDHYLGKYNSPASRQEYNRLVAEYLQRNRCSVGETPLGTTVVEVIAAYWAHIKRTRSKRSWCGFKSAFSYVKSLYGNTLASKFGPLALTACRQAMLDGEAQLSRRYVNDHCARIKQMFRWAAAEELVPASVPEALSMVDGLRKGQSTARETGPVLPVADEVVERTLQLLPSVVADMVRLQRLSGMRPSEVCILRPVDINRSGDIWMYVPSAHKTEHLGKARVVFLGPRAQDILSRYLTRSPEAFCFSPSDSEEKRLADRHAKRVTPLQQGNGPGSNRKRRPKRTPGERYTTESYRRAIHRAAQRAKVDQWSPNQLRHAAATEVRHKYGLEAAQVMLGHSRADVTQVYAERDYERAADVARKIG